MRELNEEKIIDMLIEIKNHQVAFFEPKEHKQILKNYFTQEQRDAIQGLLDLYQAEKEKNKELDRENQALYESINCDDNTMLAKLYQKEKEKNKELTDEYLIQRNLINAEFLNENYISKDKIKAKIEELEKEKSKYTGYKGLEFSRTGLINAQKLVLQELLEERK